MVLIPNQDAKSIRRRQQRFIGWIVSCSPGIGTELLQLSQAVHLPKGSSWKVLDRNFRISAK
jgi:hypothetical protein